MLARGRLPAAVALVAVATAVAALGAARFASAVPFEDVVYGDRRSPVVTTLLDTIGRDRTAIVVYLLERSWPWLIVATALTPVFVWTLGSSAAHAAATLGGARGAPFAPMLVLFGYATALARVPADIVALAVPQLGGPAGAAATLWLGVVAWRGIGAHYGQASQRALVTLAVAVVLFYLAPLVLIGLAVLAILVAAIVLEYVPST